MTTINNQAGFLPMDLAEPNDRGRNVNCKILFPLIRKLVTIFAMAIMLSVAFFVLIYWLEYTNNYKENRAKSEIILVSALRDNSNITLVRDDVEIHLRLRNKTINNKRKKRQTVKHAQINKRKSHLTFDESQIQEARRMIKEHNMLCNENNHEQVCKDLVQKLEKMTKSDEIRAERSEMNTDTSSTEINKRETVGENDETSLQFAYRDDIKSPLDQNRHSHNKLIDTCLLARLLKQNYPQLEGVYEDLDIDRPSRPLQLTRYVSPFLSPSQYNRNNEINQKQSMHPQDIEISMKFLSKSEPTSAEVFINSTAADTNCVPGTTPCLNGEECIDNSKWCDGTVDCTDVSDEARCSCKSRVDESRICDGYFDCPFGEDEMGCNGCKENMFSCEDPNEKSRIICFSKDQRCNNIADCPNRKDEIDCSLLTPSLHNKPLFAVSNTEGYLHRNFKGTWYPVCKNPYMWAHDACRRETGLIIRPPFIQLVDVDPLKRIKYINTGPGGYIHMSKTCFNSSAIYVTCPDLLCGTRMPSAVQFMHHNTDIEGDLYGRNKRFLFNRPNSAMFLGNRYKRHIGTHNEAVQYKQKSDNGRDKRTDYKVVGGIPSQPAAWPWVAALYRDGMFHCGGVILNQHWVMSAAHCVQKFWQHYYEIQVGMLRRFSFSPQEQNRRMTHVIVNQNYDQEDMRNDLSLLRVRPAIQFSRWVRPICLPGPETSGPNWRDEPKPDTICTAIGWGATVERGLDPDHLREVEVPIWSHCKHEQDEVGKEICAGLKEGGKDTCQGDSGGPLLCTNPININQWYVAGIVSHGDGCARKNEPGVYTRVSIFVDWIKFNIFSKNLPTIQPKQECPGFRCESGILKCLPKKRMCDGIIDCLNGEDEINCDTKNLPENKRETSQKQQDASFTGQEVIKTDNEENSIIFSTTPFSDTEIYSDISIKDSTNYKTTTIATVQDIGNSEHSLLDFTHASTLEINIDSASDETVIKESSNEYATSDPITPYTTDVLETHTFSINTSKNIFESISSQFKEKNISDNETTLNDTKMTNTTTQLNTAAMTALNDSFSFLDGHNINHSNQSSGTVTNSELPIDQHTTENVYQEKFTDSFTTNYPLDNINDIEITTIVTDNYENDDQTIGVKDSVLQSAKRRKKFENPIKFECRRIHQNISCHKRCDHNADCEDGTDEQDCTCVDYLYSLNKNLICDGHYDCNNGQDEVDCFACEKNQYLCKRSKQCLHSQYVCDGEINCPDGEDEENCFALSNGKDIVTNFEEKPELRLEGYISVRHNNNWHIFCEENITIQQQEKKADQICQYLGFSSANRYLVKYLNIKEEQLQVATKDKRDKRHIKSPIHFTYITVNIEDNTKSEMSIKEPEVLKEQCVPNVTKTCMSVYVYCDQTLFTNFTFNQVFKKLTEENSTLMWPWTAKIFVDGIYKCTGVLVDVSWVVISDSCLWNTVFSRQYVSVVLGSHKTLSSTRGPYEQVFRVDFKKDLYLRKVTLLHLLVNATYSSMVKPMSIAHTYIPEDNKKICVAIGEDAYNKTISILLDETSHNCFSNNRCFVRRTNSSICPNKINLRRPWSGIISCHTNLGWYPAASFVDSRGECGINNTIIGTDIGNIKNEIKAIKDILQQQSINETLKGLSEDCDGQRCGRGKCIHLRNICDGIRHCEDGNDESDEACNKKKRICTVDPLHNGCDCTTDQLKCQNGQCIPKEYFRDGKNDCDDGTDEPGETTCADYLGRVMPSRLCDGVLHCHDRSDENPKFCKCFAKNSFRCGRNFEEGDSCVANDMVCDGISDCPNGEDEKICIALSAPPRTPHGTGKVIARSHGVWFTKCYKSKIHTKSDLEAICRQLGFISGHAKQLPMLEKLFTTPHNKHHVDSFNEIVFNNKTKIKLRNTNAPIAKAVIDDSEKCNPVFIECL